jgi:transcriptional repressor NrdR
MVCVYCGSNTRIINSRHQTRNNGTWRRRTCLKCAATFTTSETAQYEQLWVVSDDKTNNLNSFERDKLFISLYDSCRHRKTAQKDATELTDTVINKLLRHGNTGSLAKNQLRDVAYSVLKAFDKVAAVHYKAYYGN